MGRFITPDWAAKATAVPYAEFADPQSLNLYSYVRNLPTTRVDKDGHVSDLVFDGAAHTITLYSQAGQKLGSWHAANNVAVHAPPGEGGGVYTHGPIQNGKYQITKSDQHGATTHLNGSPNGPYGAHGIIHIDNAKGATGSTVSGDGVHSGRQDRQGPESNTAGCIRTTDQAMSTINNIAKTDPLKTVTVQNNQANVNQWQKKATAMKAADAQRHKVHQ